MKIISALIGLFIVAIVASLFLQPFDGVNTIGDLMVMDDPLKTQFAQAIEDISGWTLEQIRKNPTIYARSAKKQMEDKLEGIKISEIDARQKIASNDEAIAKTKNDWEAAAGRLRQAEEVRKTAEGQKAWPAAYNGAPYEEAELLGVCKQLNGRLEGLGNDLKALEENASALAAAADLLKNAKKKAVDAIGMAGAYVDKIAAAKTGEEMDGICEGLAAMQPAINGVIGLK